MSVGFNDSHGAAKKSGLEYVKLEFGDNQFRIVECLSFDPAKEKFTNIETDWFKHYYPDAKCVWSYVATVLDKDGKPKLCGLKKKLFEQIQNAAKKLDDPTDPDTGWPICFEKKKTGSGKFQVEYTLDVFACKDGQRALTEEEREIADKIPPIDEQVPRMTAEEQKAFIESAWINLEEEGDKEAVEELNSGSDIKEEDAPF